MIAMDPIVRKNLDVCQLLAAGRIIGEPQQQLLMRSLNQCAQRGEVRLRASSPSANKIKYR
jgi:hypothetical protein